MKKSFLSLLVIVITLSLVLPSLSMAWSWQDLFDNKEALEMKEVDLNAIAQDKFDAWQQAVEDKSLLAVISDQDNFVITENEANYMALKALEATSDPIMTSPKIEFESGLIRIEGYLLRPISGHIMMELEVYPEDKTLVVDVVKAKYRNFYFPPFLAHKLLQKSIQKILDTLYTYPEYETIDMVIKDNQAILRYY